jgi:hypothetical protein
MKGSILLTFLYGLLSCTPAHAAAGSIPILTVCEVLRDLKRYDGMPVIIVGRSSLTNEGSCLSEECGLKVVQANQSFDPIISTAYAASEYAPPPQIPDGFRWEKRRLRQKLDQVERTTQLRRYKDRKYNDRWYAVFGRLESQPPRQISLPAGRHADIYGFGHEAASPAELISPANGYLQLK